MRKMLAATNLTELWLATPLLLVALLQQLLGITEENMHAELCDALGCRCSS